MLRKHFGSLNLTKSQSYWTIVITPFGRFRWSRLPFGLNVSSKVFQHKLNDALNGLEDVFTITDDIIIVGYVETDEITKYNYDNKLEHMYKHCEEHHLRWWKEWCRKELIFPSHKITYKGVLLYNEEIEAILKMTSPIDVSELCGLIQHISRVLPDLANMLEPMRQLTRKDIEWNWTDECESAFQAVKRQLTKHPIFCLFR